MNAITTDLAANHVDDIAWARGLDVTLSPIRQVTRHYPDGAAIDQRFTDVAVVENHRPVDSRDSAFVSACPHPGVDAAKYPRRVE